MKRLPDDRYVELAVIMNFIRYTQTEKYESRLGSKFSKEKKRKFLVITRWLLVYSRKYLVISKSFLVNMPPTSKKLTGYIGFGLCVRPCVCPFKNHACKGFEISYMVSSWKNI